MKTRRPWALLVLLPLVFGLLLSGCQKSPPPAPETAAKPAPPPPPPPPPETSAGKLVKVERAAQTMVHVHVYALTTEGIKHESRTEMKKAGKGKTFLILHFEGKPKREEPKLWLTDPAGKKYTEWYGYWKKRDQGQAAFEIPADGKDFVFHDGKQKSYRLEPAVVEIVETIEAAGTKPAAKAQ